MNQQVELLTQKPASTPFASHLSEHAAVHAVSAKVAQPTDSVKALTGSRFGHDFSQIPVRSDGPSYSTYRPRIKVKSFSAHPPAGARGRAATAGSGDKSTDLQNTEQDQNASVTSYGTHANGVSIVAEAQGLFSSPDYPDGFRWTQTIDTNVPLGGTTSPYVDPRPNDDTKPFYWTDAEHATYSPSFIDHPSRGVPASGTTTWDAILSLNGVNGTTVTRFDSLSYGFSIDSAGTVTQRGLTTPASVATHQSTLSSEFPGWTFA
jgi:hypothetical protein